MTANCRRLLLGVAACVFLAGGVSLVCCSRTTSPGVDATPGSRSEAPPAEPSPPEKAVEAGQPAEPSAPPRPPAEIDMTRPGQPEPETPRYVAIVDQYEAGTPARVRATIVAPRKLEMETTNVKKLRITREGLSLPRDRSIALQIDGQGIEWTRDYLAVELERSPAGVWEVVNRKPAKP